MFAASPETIRREPQELISLAQSANLQDLAACALCNPVDFSSAVGLNGQAAKDKGISREAGGWIPEIFLAFRRGEVFFT